MHKAHPSKSIALITSLALIFGSFPSAALAAPAMPEAPDFVQTLTPPAQLGYIDSYYQGNTPNPVILIQDLHANYGVQQKIMGLLKLLQSRIVVGGKPMVVGIEAAWGDVDTSYLSREARDVRLAAGEFLMKEAEISGMENFAANSEQPVHLVGIDNEQDYLLHRDLIRKSLVTRLALAQKIQQVRDAIAGGKTTAPDGIQKLWKTEASFEKGELGLPELSQALGVPSIANYGEAERLLYQKKAELAQKEPGQTGFFLNNLVKVDQDLALLSRLFRQQLTLEEVQFASRQVPEMLSAIQALLPGENLQEWQEAIRSAIDYYALALMRDKPLGENTRALAAQYPDTSVVAVTGGFHTAGIASLLKEKNISYVVIAPVVESQTSKDEVLYFERMLGNDVSDEAITAAARSYHRTQDTAAILAYPLRAYRGETDVAARTIAAFRNVAKLPRTVFHRTLDLLSGAFGWFQPKLQTVEVQENEEGRLPWPKRMGRYGNPGAAYSLNSMFRVKSNPTMKELFDVIDRLAQGTLIYTDIDSTDIRLIEKALRAYNEEKKTSFIINKSAKPERSDKTYPFQVIGNLFKGGNVFSLRLQKGEFNAGEIQISEKDIKIVDVKDALPIDPVIKKDILRDWNAVLALKGAQSLKELKEKTGGQIRVQVRTHDFIAETDLKPPKPTVIYDPELFRNGPSASLLVTFREYEHLTSDENDLTKMAKALENGMQALSAGAFTIAMELLGAPSKIVDLIYAQWMFINSKDHKFQEHSRETIAANAASQMLEDIKKIPAAMPDGSPRMTWPTGPAEEQSSKTPEIKKLETTPVTDGKADSRFKRVAAQVSGALAGLIAQLPHRQSDEEKQRLAKARQLIEAFGRSA